MRKPASMKALEELGRVRLSEHFFMREMLYSEIANFHGIPNIPDDPDLAIRGRNAALRGVARTPARDVWTRIDPFRIPLRRGEYVRRQAAGQGLQLREDGLESLPPRLGPAGRGRVHGGDHLHRHPLVRPAVRSGHSMASDGLVGARPPALLGHDVLSETTRPSISAGTRIRSGASTASPRRGDASLGSASRTTRATTARNIPGSRSSSASDGVVVPLPNRGAGASSDRVGSARSAA